MTPLTALYVPGSRQDRFNKAATSGADMVILDLEDSVAPDAKQEARAAVCRWLPQAGVPVQVRVNAPGSAELTMDLASLPGDVEIRLPKVADVHDLDQVVGRQVHVILESALGVERAFDIANRPEVIGLALGEADLAAELGIDGDQGFAWIRSRIVVAAAAAGLTPPMMSAFAHVADTDLLAQSCAAGRQLGLRGRAAIHPAQLPVIRSAFAPTEQEHLWAEEVLAVLRHAGVATLSDGSMVDAAMARRARRITEG